MLLSSQTDFNYDDQTSSSNSPGPPAGDGGSGRGYLGAISETVVGFIGSFIGSSGDGHEPGRNDSERRDDNQRWNHNERQDDNQRWNHNERRDNNQRWNHNERQNDNFDRDTLRDKLRRIAHTTLEVLDDGEYFPPGQDGPYDLRVKIQWTEENTRYYGQDAGEGGEILESEFIKINEEGGDEGKEEKEEERNKDGNTGAGEEANGASYLNEKQGENGSEKATAVASKPHDDNNANPKDQTRVQATVSPDPQKRATRKTSIYIGQYSTLIGARKVHLALASGNSDLSVNKKIGVLNFASAKKPGGGFINGSQAQEESLARASTLYPSLITDAASQFYTNYHEDRDNAYYTHAMVYSPGVVFFLDDNGEWRSPVEVDVLTSAAVNAGEIRREIEREERVRMERVRMEYWKKKGEERRKEVEKNMAERQRLREEAAKKKKAKEEIAKAAKLKKEQAKLVKLQKEMVEIKEMDKGKAKDSGSEKEEPFVEQDKAVAEVENENEKGEEVEVEKPEENQENQENTIDSPESGLSESQLKGAEENTESKGTPSQDDPSQPQPEAPPEVNQEPTSSRTIVHPPSPPTQPLQAPDPNPSLTYFLALEKAEIQIQQTMSDRISRILHLFQLHQTPHLILGSFGTGVFKNRIDLIATIFADLLIKPGGRFKDVFETVVFAILGEETARVFTRIFRKVDKRTQRERSCKACVFEDSSESDGDVKEGYEEKMMRMMRWKARKREIISLMDAAADAASFDSAQVHATFHPLSSDAVQASAVSYPTSSDAADAASCPPSFDAAQGDATAYAASANAAQASVASHPPSFDTRASAIPSPTSFIDAHVQVNPTAADYYRISEDAKMILTRSDEQVNFVAETTANAPLTPNAMVVDGGKDIEMTETKSLRSCELQNSRSNKKEDDDVDMQ